MAKADANKFEIGIVGLGPQGRNLARSFDDQRFSVTVFDCCRDNLAALKSEAPGSAIRLTDQVAQFVQCLAPFRTVIVTGLADASDWTLGVLSHLEAGDRLIDAAKCNFRESERRAEFLAQRHVRYFGLGIIGSKDTRWCGTVILSGGRPETHESLRPLLESIAATVNGEPSVVYLGHPSAAHFVKMVHDAIEHTLRQLVLESLELTKRALCSDEESNVVDTEQLDALCHSLRKITGYVGCPEAAADCARWTCQAACDLGIAVPTIEAAGTPALSHQEICRELAATPHRQPVGKLCDDRQGVLNELYYALQASVLITYAQAVGVLAAGSERYGYNFELAEILGWWKTSCHLRAPLLDEFAAVLRATPELPNLLCDEELSEKVMKNQEFLRQAAWRSIQWEAPVPAMMASLHYLDCHRGAWLPVNLVQVPARGPGRFRLAAIR